MDKISKCRLQCPYESCEASFTRPYRLTLHLLVHDNQRIYKCGESGCQKSYTSSSHLTRHINTFHKKVQDDCLYICPLCVKKYSNRQNLKRHLKTWHYSTRYVCDYCQQHFGRKHQLRAHMHSHTGVTSFRCHLCPKTFVSLVEKKKHIRRHKTYSCQLCAGSFSGWTQYKEHKKCAHPWDKEWRCGECGRGFQLEQHLRQHLRAGHVTALPFLCPFPDCSRLYRHKRNLTQHINIYHQQLRHSCTLCGNNLSTKAKLLQHMKTHSEPTRPKQLKGSRKQRCDKGTLRGSTAHKLANLTTSLEEPDPAPAAAEL